MPKHYDIRFAGTSNEDLIQMAQEFDILDLTGSIPKDALLRSKARTFGPPESLTSMINASLYVFRELYYRGVSKK